MDVNRADDPFVIEERSGYNLALGNNRQLLDASAGRVETQDSLAPRVHNLGQIR
jgi:hypothetical protein